MDINQEHLQVGLHGSREKLSMKRWRKTAFPAADAGFVLAVASHP
jgi:hypothetical protein